MTVPFTKVEAIGNNFVLIDALSLPEMDWSALAIKMCAHHFGVGSDGLLVLKPSDKADFKMLMFNPDGTPDSCGNGLRCMARY
ncbi:MAG TPA: diaminopimelate epimerase, partial [Armatimonadota bacterium]|nr:diaminopimelate epimerase [Armatimonadota bacterium]